MHLVKCFRNTKNILLLHKNLKPPHLPDDAPGPGSPVLVTEPPVGAAGHHGAGEAAQQLRRGLASAGGHRGAGVIWPAVSGEGSDKYALVLRFPFTISSFLTPPPLPGEGMVRVVAVVVVAARTENHCRHLPEHR